MKKLKLGTIGTSMITELFIEAAHQSGFFQLEAVYSRKLSKAEELCKNFKGEKSYSDFNHFLSDAQIDVIYIASPNSLHFEHTISALKAGKHVLVEKPATLNPKEWDSILKTAQQSGKVVIEAIRHIQEPNFKKLKRELNQIDDIQGALFPYVSYSSRYDKVLAGEIPNIFSPNFGGGALMDLGVYPIYAAVDLFGEPDSVQYFAKKIQTGVDGSGTVILRYAEFDVTLLVGKTATATLSAEIFSISKTLKVNSIERIHSLEVVDAKTLDISEVELETPAENMLYDEACFFGEILQNPDSIESQKIIKELSLKASIVSKILYDLRKDAGIIFHPNTDL